MVIKENPRIFSWLTWEYMVIYVCLAENLKATREKFQ